MLYIVAIDERVKMQICLVGLLSSIDRSVGTFLDKVFSLIGPAVLSSPIDFYI